MPEPRPPEPESPPLRIIWAETALKSLRAMPKDAAQGLVKKVGSLRKGDPREIGKPLVGPLQGLYRMRHSRYRAVYRVEDIENGERAVEVQVILAGKREDGSKKDVYALVQRLLRMAGDQ